MHHALSTTQLFTSEAPVAGVQILQIKMPQELQDEA